MKGPVVRFHRPESVKRLPWKNGLGVTEELAIDPPDAEFAALSFRWRFSKAGVAAPGPFSTFPGYDRVILVHDGGGLRLTHGDEPPVDLTPLRPHRFSGDVATYGAPLHGPVQDVNLFLRRGVVDGALAAYEPTSPLTLRLGPGLVFLHAARGALRIRGSALGDWLLPEGSSLRISGAETPIDAEVAVARSTVPASTVAPLILVAEIRLASAS